MIIYGKQLFFHVLEKMPKRLCTIYLAKECEKKLFSRIAKAGVPIVRVDAKKAQALARGGNHQGFLAEITPLEFASLDTIKNESFLVMLYGLTDVGNIGAICRTAYAFGAGGLIVSGVKQLTLEGILRTSSGAAFELPIILAPDGLSVMNELKQAGFQFFGADMHGKDVRDVKFSEKKVLVMGNEGEGIPKKALDKCDEHVSIRMVRAFDSLNVSAATAVLCDRIANE